MQLVTLKPFVHLGIHQQLCSSVLQIDLTGFFFQKVGSLEDWLFLDDWVQQCIFLLWDFVLVLTVHKALLSREARMFSPRTWRESLWLSFYNSTSCSNKEDWFLFYSDVCASADPGDGSGFFIHAFSTSSPMLSCLVGVCLEGSFLSSCTLKHCSGVEMSVKTTQNPHWRDFVLGYF